MKKLEQIFAILGALVLVLIATNISTVSAAVSSNYWKLQGGVLKPASNAWSVDSGDIAFTDTSADTGRGVWLTGNEYIATSTPGNVLSLLDFSFKNRATSTGDGQFYGLKITTEADAIDTAAGISIENNPDKSSYRLICVRTGGCCFSGEKKGINAITAAIITPVNPIHAPMIVTLLFFFVAIN